MHVIGSFLNKTEVGRETKLKVYKRVVKPYLPYRSETWATNKEFLDGNIQAIKMKY